MAVLPGGGDELFHRDIDHDPGHRAEQHPQQQPVEKGTQLLALLAAVGLLALGWLTFGRLLTPVGGGGGGPVYAVVPASGDGAHLEQDVKGLLWLRGGELARFTIVIADGGLDGTGRAVAAALLARGQGIVLCPAERLGEYIKA